MGRPSGQTIAARGAFLLMASKLSTTMPASVGLTTKPRSASRIAGASTRGSFIVPYFSSAAVRPATVPGIATAAWPLSGMAPG